MLCCNNSRRGYLSLPRRHSTTRHLLVLAYLCCVAAQNDGTSQSQCCAVLTELHKFVRERDENDCFTDVTGNCNSLPIMLEFVKQTNSLLESNSVQVNGSHLMFSIPTENEHLYKLLVYSFLGRILHEEQSQSDDYNTNKWMMFDSNSGTFQFQQSMCDFNKNIYTTLVLASISLLMFFIGVQVVAEKKSKQATKGLGFQDISEDSLASLLGMNTRVFEPVTAHGCADQLVFRQMSRANMRFKL